MRSDFFQLAGHKDCFKLGVRPRTILKKSTGNEEACFNRLKELQDQLLPFVPQVLGTIKQDDEFYIEMQDLLAEFCFHGQDNCRRETGTAAADSMANQLRNISVMDVKMGCRTYREEELGFQSKAGQVLRHDMYEKMVQVDESEPTTEENTAKAITKPRYMIWRETVSSTAKLGFRIEGMRLCDGSVDKNFKTVKDTEHIIEAFLRYTQCHTIRLRYLQRLKDLRQALLSSKFFWTHELIGSSLLFVHNLTDDPNGSHCDANIWLIDLAKTHCLPKNMSVTHKDSWKMGNHEDGFLIGVENLISIFETMISKHHNQIAKPSPIAQETKQSSKCSTNSTTSQQTWQTNNKQALHKSCPLLDALALR